MRPLGALDASYHPQQTAIYRAAISPRGWISATNERRNIEWHFRQREEIWATPCKNVPSSMAAESRSRSRKPHVARKHGETIVLWELPKASRCEMSDSGEFCEVRLYRHGTVVRVRTANSAERAVEVGERWKRLEQART